MSEGAGELHCEFRISRGTDQAVIWIEARNLIFYDADGRALRVVGVNVDVTEQKRAIVQLRAFTETLEERVRERTRELEAEFAARQKAEESLRQTQKMEAVGQLTGGIAHDFNNLLTVVLGGLEVIGRQLSNLPESPPVARIRKAREMSVQGARRAAALVHRLMAFSRQQPLTPTVRRCRQAGRQHLRAASPHPGRDDRARDGARPQASGLAMSTPTSLRMPSSISR